MTAIPHPRPAVEFDDVERRNRGHAFTDSTTLQSIELFPTTPTEAFRAGLTRIVNELPTQFRRAQLPAITIVTIVQRASELFMSQPNLVEVPAPVNICGDIHGQFEDLLYMFDQEPPIGGKYLVKPRQRQSTQENKPNDGESKTGTSEQQQEDGDDGSGSYVFLGDYVDRGNRGIETAIMLMAYKLLEPDRIVLLRGNHESGIVTRTYGFLDECKRRYSMRLWKQFIECFNRMPVAALVERAILCMHGGISPDIKNVFDIAKYDQRPCEVGDNGYVCDLLWADPSDDEAQSGWLPSSRGVSYTFGLEKLQEFMKSNDLDLICRAHQVMEQGYQFYGPNRELVTVFSATNYCGEYSNYGAMLKVGPDMRCSFKTFEK